MNNFLNQLMKTASYQQINRGRYVFTVLLFLSVAIISYVNILSGGFIWDDHCLIVDNPFIKQGYDFSRVLFSELHQNTSTNYYRPLQIFSYKIDYIFFGLNPAGYHLSNILLHAFAGTLLFFLLVRLTGHYFLSLASTLFFLVHPINAGAVAYISGRADLLAAVLVFSSLLFYLKTFYPCSRQVLFLCKKNICYYAGSLGMFILALLTKEVVIVLPFVLCGIDILLLQNKGRWKRVIVFFVILLIYLLARFTVLNFSSGNPFLCKEGFAVFDVGFLARAAAFLKTLLIYIGSVFIPVNLHMERVVAVENISVFLYIGIILFFLVCAAALKHLARTLKGGRRLFLFAVFWFFIWLAPQSAFILPKIMADHFLYFPAIGLFLIIAVSMDSLHTKKILLAFICFYFCGFTWFYNQVWRDEFSFFSWTTRQAPSSYKAHDCLADLYLKMGRLEDAAGEYRAIISDSLHLLNENDIDALAFKPRQNGRWDKKRKIASAVFYNLGVVLDRQGKSADAVAAYLNAIKLNAESEQAYNNVGLVYEKTGDFQRAEEMYSKAIILNKDYIQPYNNLAVLYVQKGDLCRAIKFWNEVLRLEPEYETAQKNMFLAQDLMRARKDEPRSPF